MTTIAEARSKIGVTPIYLLEITLLGTSPPTLYFSDRNIIISNQIYLDFIDSLDGIGEEIKFLTSENLNADITINFKNDPFQTYSYLSQIGDVYPFDGASCTIKEVYKLQDGTYSDVETIFVGVLDEPREITLTGFLCNVSDKVIFLDEKFNQKYFNRTDYPLLPSKSIGKIVNEIGFGTVDEVLCTGIDVGIKTVLEDEITDSDTYFNVEDGSLFPSNNFVIQIGSELMHVATRSLNVFSGITRGYNGTIPNEHIIKDVYEVKTEYVYHLFDHPIQSIDKVFIDEKKQNDGYTAYTGKTGDEHPDWPGKAVIAFTTEAFVGKQRNLTSDEAESNDSFIERDIFSTVFSHPITVPHKTRTGEITQLDGEINESVTSFDVINGASFPTSNFVIQIEDELMFVDNRTNNTFSGITRGYNDTDSAEHLTELTVTQIIYSIGSLMPQDIQIFGFPITEYGTIAEQRFVIDLRGLNRKGDSQGNQSIYLYAFVSIIDSVTGVTKALEKYSFMALDGNKIGGSVEISINGGNWDDYVTVAVSGNHWTANDEYTTVEATNVHKVVRYTPLTKQYGMTVTENNKSYDSILRSDQLISYGPIASWYFSTSSYAKDFSFIEKNLKRIEQQVDRIIYDKPVGVSIGEEGKGGLATRLRTQEISENNYYFDASTGIEIIYKTTEQDGAIFKQKHSFSTDGETEASVIHMAALTKETVTKAHYIPPGMVDTFDGGQGRSILALTSGIAVNYLGVPISGYTDIISVQTGGNYDYYSGLKSDGTVITNFAYCDTSSWTDIIQISGDAYTGNCLFGLKSNGDVVSTGVDPNSTGKLNVSGWGDMIQVAACQQISSDSGHTIALQSDGSVWGVGGNGTYGEMALSDIGNWENIVQITAGWCFSAGLKSDGTVEACGPTIYLNDNTGSINERVKSMSNIVQIAASANILIGLKSDGTVMLISDNLQWGIHQNTIDSWGTDSWTDIVQVSRNGTNGVIAYKSDGTFVQAGNGKNISAWNSLDPEINSRITPFYTEEIPHVISYKEFKVTNNSSANYQLEYSGGRWDDYTVVSISPERFRKSSVTENRSYIAIRNPKKEIEYISIDIEGADGGNYDSSAEKILGLKISATASFIEDDSTYSGISETLLYRPDYVTKYILKEHLGYLDSEIDSSSFTAAGNIYDTESLRLDFVIDFPIGKTSDRFSEILKSLVSQSRSILFFKQGKWYLHYLPDTIPDSLKTINYKELANGQFVFQRTPRNEIFNNLQIFYKKNYSKEGTAYDEVYKVTDSTSITKYGERPFVFELWAVRDETTAENYANFQLNQRKNPRTIVGFSIFFEHFDLHQYDTFDIVNPINTAMKFSIENIKRSGKGVLEISGRSWT
jgi:alpha-tubulin suppressor-like RCC1 family protein